MSRRPSLGEHEKLSVEGPRNPNNIFIWVNLSMYTLLTRVQSSANCSVLHTKRKKDMDQVLLQYIN